MRAQALLSRLDGVRKTGSGRWSALCPAHPDKSPSLAVSEKDDGVVLLHCFAGCHTSEVIESVGLQIADLFPQRKRDPAYVGKPDRRPFPAADILRAVTFEITIVCLHTSRILAGEHVTSADRDRIYLAHTRLQNALAAGGLHE